MPASAAGRCRLARIDSYWGKKVSSEQVKIPFVSQQLREKASLFEERNKIYGDNYLRFGPIMALLLGNQTIDLANPLDMARIGVLVQIVSKVTRYCENFSRGGHPDSLDDLSVYSMMLKQIDQEGLPE